MLLPKWTYRFSLTLLYLFFVLSCSTHGSFAEEATLSIDTFKKLSDLFKEDQNDEIDALLSKWADYVHKTTQYSNREYLDAIDRIQIEYYREIAKYEDIARTERTDRKKHSSIWFNTIVDHFGKEYIRKNKNAVVDNIQFLFLKRHEYYYEDIKQRLLYKEIMLYNSYRNYLGMFVKFFNNQNHDNRIILESRKEAVDAFLLMLDRYSMSQLLFSEDKPNFMLSAIRVEGTNKKLSSYFETLPDIRYFDAMKFTKDLLEVTD